MLTISTNVPSLNAQRQLAQNNNALSKSFQRLSSGLRINSAQDDAAGLAISNRLTSQIRGLNQAVRNSNDAMSLAQTAESALGETNSMLQRIRELAVQAANDTYTATDRAAIQTEVDQLLSEVDRIATQTEFNGRSLLDGSFNGMRFQVGANEGQNIEYSIDSARAFALGAVAEQESATVTGTALTAGELTLNGVEIRSSSATDDSLSSTGNAASAVAKAAAINASSADHGVTASVDETSVSLGAVSADTFADGDFEINGVSIGAVTTVADDGDFALRNAVNAVSDQTGVLATLDDANNLVLTAADGRNIDISGTDPQSGVFGADPTGTTYGTVTLESDESFDIGGGTPGNAGLTAGTVDVNTAVNATTINLGTQSGADDAIGLLDTAIRQVSTQQANLGAILSRMNAAVSNLSAASENISAARGRIQDADFAAETAKFSKNQILQQASTAMLAQANVSTQSALQLIGG
jgi:flagellin